MAEYAAAYNELVNAYNEADDEIHKLKLPNRILCDVIAQVHFYHIKGYLMQVWRKVKTLPGPDAHITVFADLS